MERREKICDDGLLCMREGAIPEDMKRERAMKKGTSMVRKRERVIRDESAFDGASKEEKE